MTVVEERANWIREKLQAISVQPEDVSASMIAGHIRDAFPAHLDVYTEEATIASGPFKDLNSKKSLEPCVSRVLKFMRANGTPEEPPELAQPRRRASRNFIAERVKWLEKKLQVLNLRPDETSLEAFATDIWKEFGVDAEKRIASGPFAGVMVGRSLVEAVRNVRARIDPHGTTKAKESETKQRKTLLEGTSSPKSTPTSPAKLTEGKIGPHHPSLWLDVVERELGTPGREFLAREVRCIVCKREAILGEAIHHQDGCWLGR